MAERATHIPPHIFSVSELNRKVKQTLENNFSVFWISGEISNLTRAASGHWYFSLKDDQAQVRCVMFKGRNSHVDFIPREGDHIEARALVSLYEARGDFQLTLESMQQAGLGRLYAAFEQLKQRLNAQGLFAAEHKQPIPAHPQRIGVVTSLDAAALHDVLTAIRRRHPGMPVIIYPTAVQGQGAAEQIANAIRLASLRNEVDVLLICRGGGSMEDLWSFNEEVVAHAMFECVIPTISGVGHETDVTIADFVADLRAATPTAAAELACPDLRRLLLQWSQLQQRWQRAMQYQLQRQTQTLDYLARRLISPKQQLQQRQIQLQQWQQRLQNAMAHRLQTTARQVAQAASGLQQLNPHNVLARGYAIVRTAQGATIHDAAQVEKEAHIHVQLHHGALTAIVTDKQVTP